MSNPTAKDLLHVIALYGSGYTFAQLKQTLDDADLCFSEYDFETLLQGGWLRPDNQRYAFESERTRRAVLQRIDQKLAEGILNRWETKTPKDGLLKAELFFVTHQMEKAAASLISVARFHPGESEAWLRLAEKVRFSLMDAELLNVWVLVVQGYARNDDPWSRSSQELVAGLTSPGAQQDPVAGLRLQIEHFAIRCHEFLNPHTTDAQWNVLRSHGLSLFHTAESLEDRVSVGLIMDVLGWVEAAHPSQESREFLTRLVQIHTANEAFGPASLAAMNLSHLLRDDVELSRQYLEDSVALANKAQQIFYLPQSLLGAATHGLEFDPFDKAATLAHEAWRIGMWGKPNLRVPLWATYAMAHAANSRSSELAEDLLDELERLVPARQRLRVKQIIGARAVVAAFANDTTWWSSFGRVDGITLEMFAEFAARAWESHGRDDLASDAREKLAPSRPTH